MKRVLSLSLMIASAMILTQPAYGQDVIAFFDFNDGFVVEDETAQIVHNASIGSGLIYQQRADTDGNGKGGNPYANALLGINVIDGQSIAWDDVAKSGPNDAELFITFSTTGFENIELSYDGEGNDEGGISAYDIKYDANPLEDIVFEGNTIKDFAGGNSTFWDDDFTDDVEAGNNLALAAVPDVFTRFTIDFSPIAAANNQSFFAVRFDDIDENDDFRLDNVLVTGTPIAVPEPSSLALVISGCIATMLRRRRVG